MVPHKIGLTLFFLAITSQKAELPKTAQLLRQAAQEIESKQFSLAEHVLARVLGQSPRSALANNLMGVCRASVGDKVAAQKLFERSIRLDPSFLSARINLGNLLLSKHEEDLALKQFEAALVLDPHALTRDAFSYSGFTLQGLCRMDQRRYVEAMQAFRRCVQIDPRNATGYVDLGIALIALRRDPDALQVFDKALAIRPNDVIALYNVGLIYARRKQFDQAWKYLDQAHIFEPNAARVELALAETAIHCGKLDEANVLIETLQKHDKLNPLTRKSLAAELLSLGHPARAVRLIEGNPELAMQFYQSSYRMADHFLEDGDPVKCITILVAIRVLHPPSAAFHALLGSAYYEGGDPRNASNEFQQAIHQDPSNSNYYFKLGMVFLKYHTPKPAILVFQHALKIRPGSPRLWFGLGLSEYFASDLSGGERDLRKAVALQPDYALAYVVLGDLLETGGRIHEAIQAFNEAIRIEPGWFVPYYMYGKAESHVGTAKLPEAIMALRKAIALNPRFAHAHFELGSALEQAGRLQEASQELTRSLQLDPELARAHYRLAQVYLKLSNHAAAMQQFHLFESHNTKDEAADSTRRLIVEIGGH